MCIDGLSEIMGIGWLFDSVVWSLLMLACQSGYLAR